MASLDGISEDKITAYTYMKFSDNEQVMEFTYRIRKINYRLDRLHYEKDELKAGRFLPIFCGSFGFLFFYFLFWIGCSIFLIGENFFYGLIVFLIGLWVFIMFRRKSMNEYKRNEIYIMDDRTNVDL